jgi:hypothetical protein
LLRGILGLVGFLKEDFGFSCGSCLLLCWVACDSLDSARCLANFRILFLHLLWFSDGNHLFVFLLSNGVLGSWFLVFPLFLSPQLGKMDLMSSCL